MRTLPVMGRLPAFNLRLVLILVLAVAAIALVACGDDDDDSSSSSSSSSSGSTTSSGSSSSGSSDAAPTEAAGAKVEGTVSLEGSSTVQPFTLELIPEFEKEYPDAKINPPSGLGSGAGISAFINKEVDIAQASRAMKADEIDQAKAAGLDPFETTILRDALAIVVHPDNPITELSEEQVAKIFAGEITSWDDVGGSGKITVYTRNEESGTFAYMEEDVIQKVLSKESGYAADVNKQASAPAGLSAVAGDPDGIFYAGLGNLSEIPQGSVKVLLISGTGAAVAPSAATVEDGSYPIARGLFYYTNGDPSASDNAALKAFVELALAPTGQKIGEGLGFLPVGPTE
jgi:phosphate transport system substrate-binding protein